MFLHVDSDAAYLVQSNHRSHSPSTDSPWPSATAHPLKTDNSTSNAFVNKSLRQKKSKLCDMKFHWLRDKTNAQHLRVFWDAGKQNMADYFTTHHHTPYHKLMRSKYILALHHISKFPAYLRSGTVARARVCWNVPPVHYITHVPQLRPDYI